jgi:tetratricopeptide (TPR) repeat protein
MPTLPLLTLHAALVLAACSLVPPRALAQDGSPHADTEARALFDAGRAAFSAGRFEEALGHFRRSFELSGRAELHYNVGISADRLRRDAEALEAFRRYLAEVPGAENQEEVEARIAILERELASEAVEPEPQPEPEPDGASEEAPEEAAQDDTGPRRDGTGQALGIAGGVIAGVGLVAGAVLGGLALSTDADLGDRCGNGCPESELDGLFLLTALTDASFALSLVGATLLAVGLGIELGGSEEAPRLAATVIPGPEGAVVLFGGSL